MGTHWGNEGTVKLGANTVAEIDNWQLDISVTPVDDSAMGDSWKTHIAGSGMKSWTAAIECHWDETDTNGQLVLVAGASVTLNLYPEGATSGDKYWTGTASVVGEAYDVQKDGSTIRAKFNMMGNGSCSVATV